MIIRTENYTYQLLKITKDKRIKICWTNIYITRFIYKYPHELIKLLPEHELEIRMFYEAHRRNKHG